MSSIRPLAIVVLGLLVVVVPAHADPAKCEKTLLSGLRKYKKTYLKEHSKCLDAENIGKIAGPCPGDLVTSKTATVKQSVVDKTDAACTMADLATLGYPANCALEAGVAGKEAQCAAFPVATPGDFARCLACWKDAELAEYLAILYASHADEVCGGDLGETSTVCSDLDCATPLPDQLDLGDTGQNDCQRAIGKVGVKYLLSREKALEKCGLAGSTQAVCLADLKVQAALTKASDKVQAGIKKKCGNRDPVASAPFCCRVGTGNSCVAATSRDDCEMNLGGTVQEDKICGLGGTCDPTPGGNPITWWENCPEAPCGAAPLATLDDLISCVGTSADAVVDELLCIQFPSGWPCPPADGSPSGAFLER